MKTGILSTPGLEINGKMISSGKLPTKSTLVNWIQNNISQINRIIYINWK